MGDALQEHRLMDQLLRVLARITGTGMRAKDENSSTMRPISPTWRMIVSVHCWNTSGSVVTSLPYLRLRRSAESWIGVSGFLISCAMRRATSAQAAVRCAETRSVMSSKVTMKSPASLLAVHLHAQAAHRAAALDGRLAARAADRLLQRATDEARQFRHRFA
jgi:hypothetical protein